MVSSLSIIVTWTQHIDQRRHFIQQHSQCIVIPFWSLTSLAGWSLKGINRGHSATMTGITLKKCKAKQHMLACGFVRWIQSLSRKSWSDLKAAHGFVLHMHERMTSEVTGIVPPQVKIQSLSNHPCQRKGRVMFCGPQNTCGTSQQNSEAAFSRTTEWWVLLKRDLDYTGDAVFFFFGFGSPESKNWFNKTLCTCLLQGKNLLS